MEPLETIEVEVIDGDRMPVNEDGDPSHRGGASDRVRVDIRVTCRLSFAVLRTGGR